MQACRNALRKILETTLLRRNKVAQIHDDHLTEISANCDNEMDRGILRDLEKVQTMLLHFRHYCSIYSLMRADSRWKLARVDRAQKRLREFVAKGIQWKLEERLSLGEPGKTLAAMSP